GNSIVINASDEAYITGRTTSSDYPATPGAYDVTYNGGTYGDVIVSHLNASGSSLLASTYLGSPTLDIGWGIDLDANMNVFVAGYTDNAAFPTTLCAYDRTYNGTNDADYFIAKFDPALKKLMYSTYVGGNDQDYWEPKIKLKGTPCNQMAVCSGTSHSTNFPTTAGSFESTKLNGVDDQPTVYMLSPKIKGGFTITPNPVCGGATALLHDTTSDCGLWGDTLTIHHWDFGDGTTGNGVTAVHAYPSNGTYTVTLIVGCPMDTVKKVVTISSGFNLTTSSTSPGCSASSGSITATPSGGPGPFVYSWSNGATTQTVSGLPAGSYTVTVTGAGGCTQTDTVTLNSTGGPTLALAAQNDPLCNGGNNGSATIQASGGTVPYSFSWSPSGGTSATATGLHGGTYTCTVKDANGCIQTQTVTLNEPTAITVSSTSVNTNCGTATGSASVAATGGTGTLSYSWTPTGGTTANATNLSAGNYTCTITDANGCSQQTSVAVNSTGGPTITIASQSDPLCHGGSNGNATISASGGTSPYTYSWFPSGGTSATASGLASGTYTCTVTDASSCVHTQTVIITQPVVITDSTNITNASCGTNNGTALVDADGGTGTLTYSWSSPSGVTGPIASGLGAGTYTCVVSDANGCTLTQTVTLTQSPALVVTATAASGCGSRGGSAAATVTGGSGSYTYSWSPTGGTSSTANGLGTGTYTCTVNDAAGCLKTTIVAVTTDSIPMAGAGSNVTIHYGDSIVLNASGGGTYSWYPYTDLSCSACQRPSAHPSATTEYCVLVTNAKGCKDSSCVTVSIDYDCGEVYVPNFFSPNGDGKNDRLCIYGNCIQTLQFRIYDRWGEQVFETKNALVCWDGTFRGQNMNSAVFVYYLQAVLINGQTVTQKGNITLLR
ncbi:MAG TPA: gliding motility-associated C-terminal domain-containing protein, partial [Bacteroidia bacterium]|nr:gliding motility-associated C-terminal domain-containing protein [Bacteroidia bacterium]